MDDEEKRVRRQIAERLDGPEGMTVWAGFFMAAIASDRPVKRSVAVADEAMAALRKRFT